MSVVADKAVQRKKAAFLAAYSTLGNLSATERLTGIARQRHHEWVKADPAYLADFLIAQEQAIDALESEARRRAVNGVEKPVYQGGKLVGSVQEYSDTLLIFLLKGARPDKYRERVDMTVNIRDRAAKIADELGVPVEDVIAEAERIAAGRT
jgi:hypothetical protein